MTHETSPVVLSLEVALSSTLATAPLAVALGFLLSRAHFRGKWLLSATMLLPLVVPPVVTGFVLLSLFSRTGPLGRALATVGISVPLTLTGAVLAAGVVGLPLFVLSARAAFDAVPVRYEEVAQTLGLSRWATFVKVTLPLALPGLAGGAVLSFARGLGEFGATIVLAGDRPGETRTLAVAVYALLSEPGGDERAKSLVATGVALSLVAVVGYEALLGWQARRVGGTR